MRSLVFVSIAAFVSGCGSSGASDQPTNDGSTDDTTTSNEGGSDASGDDDSPLCPSTPQVIVSGAPMPGATVSLTVSPPFTGLTRWTASKGTITPDGVWG